MHEGMGAACKLFDMSSCSVVTVTEWHSCPRSTVNIHWRERKERAWSLKFSLGRACHTGAKDLISSMCEFKHRNSGCSHRSQKHSNRSFPIELFWAPSPHNFNNVYVHKPGVPQRAQYLTLMEQMSTQLSDKQLYYMLSRFSKKNLCHVPKVCSWQEALARGH